MQSYQPSNSTRDAEVLIIGGGVIGLSIARELALRGVRNVTVIERGEFGKEASWAAAGILAPQVEADRVNDFFTLACASRDLYPDFVESLREQTGIDVGFDQTGTLYLGFNEHDEKELRRRYEWQTAAGLRVEWLNGDEARRLPEVLARHDVGGVAKPPHPLSPLLDVRPQRRRGPIVAVEEGLTHEPYVAHGDR